MPVSSTATTRCGAPGGRSPTPTGSPARRAAGRPARCWSLPLTAYSHHCAARVAAGRREQRVVRRRACRRRSRAFGTTHSTSGRLRSAAASRAASSPDSSRSNSSSCAARPVGFRRARRDAGAAAEHALPARRRARVLRRAAMPRSARAPASCDGASFSLTIRPRAGRRRACAGERGGTAPQQRRRPDAPKRRSTASRCAALLRRHHRHRDVEHAVAEAPFVVVPARLTLTSRPDTLVKRRVVVLDTGVWLKSTLTSGSSL